MITVVLEGFHNQLGQTYNNIWYVHSIINQVRGRPIKLHLQICVFYPLQCDIIILTSAKITQAIHLLLDICKNGKLFFNPGISIFRISICL